MFKLVNETFSQFKKRYSLNTPDFQHCYHCNALLNEIEFYENKDFIIVDYKGIHLDSCLPGVCFTIARPKDQTGLKEALANIE